MCLRPDLAIVQSLDFFMPIVDDPFTFGQIAAANSISDLYAMGAKPISALAILGFPKSKLPLEVAQQIMAGGASVCQSAGISISGGHSIDDAEPKFGLSVTGLVHPKELWRNSTGKAGDFLILTKPIGVGALGQGIKKDMISQEGYAQFVNITTHLNESAMVAGRKVGVNAATDVTGFGLIGHCYEMAKGAGLGAIINASSLPVIPEALALITKGIHPGATGRNMRFSMGFTHYNSSITEELKRVLADPQTSGGLLFAVSPENAEALLAELKNEGTPCASVIGRLTDKLGIWVEP